MKLPLFLALLLALLVFSVAGAQDEVPAYDAHGLLIYNVWVRPTAGELAEGATPEPPIPGTTTGAYMTIRNTSETAYQLVGIETDAAEMTHVHETTLEGDVARMRMIRAVDIPAGETVALAPLGYHAMLMNVTRDVRPGEAVALTLAFADANGDTFDVPIAAYATDFPAEDTLIIANAVAVTANDGALMLSLLVANKGNTSETLTVVTTVPPSTATLLWREQRSAFPVNTIELPPHTAAPFALPDVFIHIHLSEFSLPSSAFTLTLEFASGTTLTVAVPVIGAAS